MIKLEKKKYEKPVVKAHKLSTPSILAGSDPCAKSVNNVEFESPEEEEDYKW